MADPYGRPNTNTQRPCLDCPGVLRRREAWGGGQPGAWRHEDGATDHRPRPAPREYDPPCRCGRATAHLRGDDCG